MQSVLRFVYQEPFHWLIKRRTKAWKQNRERYSREKSRKMLPFPAKEYTINAAILS